MRVKRHGHLEKEKQNTKLKEKLPMSLTLFLCLCHYKKKQLNQARGIWHFIGGWYKYSGSKNIFLVGAREGKDEPPSVDW